MLSPNFQARSAYYLLCRRLLPRWRQLQCRNRRAERRDSHAVGSPLEPDRLVSPASTLGVERARVGRAAASTSATQPRRAVISPARVAAAKSATPQLRTCRLPGRSSWEWPSRAFPCRLLRSRPFVTPPSVRVSDGGRCASFSRDGSGWPPWSVGPMDAAAGGVVVVAGIVVAVAVTMRAEMGHRVERVVRVAAVMRMAVVGRAGGGLGHRRSADEDGGERQGGDQFAVHVRVFSI